MWAHRLCHRAAPARCFSTSTTVCKPRIVLTHSTHAPGVIDALHALADSPAGQDILTTLVPARLGGRTQGNAEHLAIRVSTQTDQGFKLIARKGTYVQEIFAVCVPGTSAEALQAAVDQAMPRSKRYKERQAK